LPADEESGYDYSYQSGDQKTTAQIKYFESPFLCWIQRIVNLLTTADADGCRRLSLAIHPTDLASSSGDPLAIFAFFKDTADNAAKAEAQIGHPEAIRAVAPFPPQSRQPHGSPRTDECEQVRLVAAEIYGPDVLPVSPNDPDLPRLVQSLDDQIKRPNSAIKIPSRRESTYPEVRVWRSWGDFFERNRQACWKAIRYRIQHANTFRVRRWLAEIESRADWRWPSIVILTFRSLDNCWYDITLANTNQSIATYSKVRASELQNIIQLIKQELTDRDILVSCERRHP